jgi:Rho termination factor, N-terminal domain
LSTEANVEEDHMPGKKHGPSIKDAEQYEALRDQGMSKEKAARISNESAGSSRSEVGRRGGKAEDLEDRTVEELRDRARELGIENRSEMDKADLVDAIRNH